MRFTAWANQVGPLVCKVRKYNVAAARKIRATTVLVHARARVERQCDHIACPTATPPNDTLRPPSDGRPSIQYVSAPSRCGLEKLTLLATIMSVVIGERHSPYGAVVRPRVGLLINETPEMRVRPGTHSLGWLVNIRQEMTFAKSAGWESGERKAAVTSIRGSMAVVD